jgi:hypothetical protein
MPPANEEIFDIFLSHNSEDKLAVIQLANKLKELDFNPWLDDWHLVPGESWLPVVNRVLETCTCCAVIIGPHGMGNVHESEMWVALQRALETKQGDRRFRTIPILLPNATRGDLARLPLYLTANTWIEFHQSIDDPRALKRLTLGPGEKADRIAAYMEKMRESPKRLHLVAQGAMPANDPAWRLVIFVDQFEELFTTNIPDSAVDSSDSHRSALNPDQMAFVQNLLHAAMISNGRTIVILTMRADFYGKCASVRELANAVSDDSPLVGPMNAEDLRRAVESPALLARGEIEPGLVDLLVAEVAGQSGALPLLQSALEELWAKTKESGSSKLTTANYRELGGWKGVLSRRANMVLDKFRKTPQENKTPQEKLCRELFLRLVQPGEGTEDTKRLVRWEELQAADPSDSEALEQVVWTLADERLITTGLAESYGEQPGRKLAAGATVEVIHEALIRDWNELRKWLDADRESIRTHRKLTAAANEWVKSAANSSQRNRSFLYTGSRLSAARELVERGTVKLNADETAFIDASIQEIRAKKRRAVFKRGLESLASADPAELPQIIEKLARYPELAATYLQPKISWKFETGEETQEEKQQQLHYRLAQVAHDQRLVKPLLEQLLNNKIAYIGPISEQLRPYAGELTETLWEILRNDQAPAKYRLHAAAALAHSAADLAAESWTNTDLEFMARQLVSANAEFQPQLRKNLQSVSEKLLPELERVFSDPQSTDGERLSAANALADYAANEIPRLSHLLSVATPEQFKVLYPIVESNHATTKVEVLGKIAATLPPVDLGSVERIGFGQHRANAAVALLRMGQREQAMSVFELTDDPEALTQFIFRCREREVRAEALLDCLDMVSQTPADRYPKNSRYGLMLALGEYSLEKEIPEARRGALVAQLVDWYRHDPSSGVHSASG